MGGEGVGGGDIDGGGVDGGGEVEGDLMEALWQCSIISSLL